MIFGDSRFFWVGSVHYVDLLRFIALLNTPSTHELLYVLDLIVMVNIVIVKMVYNSVLIVNRMLYFHLLVVKCVCSCV